MAEYQALEQQQPSVQVGERTGFQAVITSPWVMRWASIPTTYAVYREIRKQPTIALARLLSTAPILAAEWSIKADDDTPSEWLELIQDMFMPLRERYLEPTLLYGNVDFGYMPFEKIFEDKDGYKQLTRLKPLLHDITEICIGQRGQFVGFRQMGVDIGIANAMHIGFRVEGAYLYGIPLLENIRQSYYDWLACNDGAKRYDNKIAGSHVVIQYPPGQSIDCNGITRDNSELAKEIMITLESSGCVAIPRDMAAYVQQLSTTDPGWKIEMLTGGESQQQSFVSRLDYLDKLMCRGLLLPERTVLEGMHGTKAEAEAHTDIAMTSAELEHKRLTRELNEQAVDQVLTVNFGSEAAGTVRIEASPIVDTKKETIKEVYLAFLNNPAGFLEESGKLDMDAMKDQLGIPKVHDTEAADKGTTEGSPAPLPGMDTTDPMAAETRRLYRNVGGQMVDEPTTQGTPQGAV